MPTPTDLPESSPSASLPYFAFFASDWLSSTSVLLLTAAEEGTFIRLLSHAWLNDGLPDDAAQCAKLTKLSAKAFTQAWARLQPMFPVALDGKRRNPRQEMERVFALDKKARRVAAGRKGASKRWPDERSQERRAPPDDSNATPIALATAWQTDSNAIAMLSDNAASSSIIGQFQDDPGRQKASEPDESSRTRRFVPQTLEGLESGAEALKQQDEIIDADSNAISMLMPSQCVGISTHTHNHSYKALPTSSSKQLAATSREPRRTATDDAERRALPDNRRLTPDRRVDDLGHATRVLTAAANKGIAEKFGDQPVLLVASHAGSYKCAEALLNAGVTLDFAADAIFECARTLQLERPPRSLGYFLHNALDQWVAAAARRDAANFTPNALSLPSKPVEGDQMRYAAMRYAQEGHLEWQAYCDEHAIVWQVTSS